MTTTPKPRPGRPVTLSEPARARNVAISDSDDAYIVEQGGGNRAAGICGLDVDKAFQVALRYIKDARNSIRALVEAVDSGLLAG